MARILHPIKALLPERMKLTRPRLVTAGRGLGKNESPALPENPDARGYAALP